MQFLRFPLSEHVECKHVTIRARCLTVFRGLSVFKVAANLGVM